MQSLNNFPIIGYCNNNQAGLVGKASFAYNEGAKTLTVTDESTVTAPDTFKILHVDVYDHFGGKRYAKINAASENVVVNLDAIAAAGAVAAQPALNLSRGLAVAITVVTTQGKAKDGSTFKIANSQNAGQFDVEK